MGVEKEKKKIKIPGFLKKINYKKCIKYAIILGILVFIGFKVKGMFKDVQQMVTPTIETAIVTKGDLGMVLSGKGAVEPLDQYKVNALVKGEILKAPFEEGQEVKKGDLLYQISTKDVENSIKAAKLSVQKAEKGYLDVKDNLNDLSMQSRETGYVKKLYIRAGDKIQAGATIADIYDNDTMYIDVPFNSADVSTGWVGSSAVVYMDGSMEALSGTVTEVSNFEETLPGNMLVRNVTIRVRNPGGIATGVSATAAVGNIDCNSNGTFRPATEKSLIADASGEIDKLYLKEDGRVSEGETILTFSKKDIQSQLENSDIVVKEAKLSLENQTNQLDNYSITAPISGQVITKNKKQGDTIDMSATTDGTLVIIYDLSALTFKMNVDELDIKNVALGQKVKITADALPGAEFLGKVDKISLNSTNTNGVTLYPVTIRIDKKGDLLPGMNVTGKIITKSVKGVLTVPVGAVQRNNVVYVKDPTYKPEEKEKTKEEKANEMMWGPSSGGAPEGFKEAKVTTGVSDGMNIEIISGLKEGDEVYAPAAGMSGGSMGVITMAPASGSTE